VLACAVQAGNDEAFACLFNASSDHTHRVAEDGRASNEQILRSGFSPQNSSRHAHSPMKGCIQIDIVRGSSVFLSAHFSQNSQLLSSLQMKFDSFTSTCKATDRVSRSSVVIRNACVPCDTVDVVVLLTINNVSDPVAPIAPLVVPV
jgi:hypothetical protein